MVRQNFQELLAKNAVNEARLGDPYPLIGRVHFCLETGEPMSNDEIRFIVEALKATARKRCADNLRKIEQFLIAEQVKGLMNDGMSQKAVIDEVMRHRHRSRRHIYKAIAAHNGKNRGG